MAAESAPVIALAGCGRWGRNILRDLISIGCEVHVASRGAESRAVAGAAGAASVCESVADLPDFDGAVVATPTDTHAAVIDELAARFDGPIFCEKPLCLDPAEADRLAAEHAGRLFLMDKWRYHPGVLEFARIAREGELGEVRSLHMRRVTDSHAFSDGDTVWRQMPHDLTIALEILGELPPAHSAVAERGPSRRVGIHAVLGPPWVTIEVSESAPGHRRELRMICERGSVIMDGGWAEQIAIRRHDGSPDELRDTVGELPLLAELRAFVNHLRGGDPPASSALEGALVVRRIAELGEISK